MLVANKNWQLVSLVLFNCYVAPVVLLHWQLVLVVLLYCCIVFIVSLHPQLLHHQFVLQSVVLQFGQFAVACITSTHYRFPRFLALDRFRMNRSVVVVWIVVVCDDIDGVWWCFDYSDVSSTVYEYTAIRSICCCVYSIELILFSTFFCTWSFLYES